jgi:hypothetical protein
MRTRGKKISLELSTLLRHGTVLSKRLMWGLYGVSLRDDLAMPRSSIGTESDPPKVSPCLLDMKYFFMGRTKFPQKIKGHAPDPPGEQAGYSAPGTCHIVHMAFLTRD